MKSDSLYHPITLALKLTDFCPNNCLDGRYCFAECNPRSRQWIDRNKVEDIFHQAKQQGFTELIYVSTEPFTDINLLTDVTKKAKKAGLAPRFLVTNGKIGRTYENARTHFKKIQDAGFDFSIKKGYFSTGYNGIDVTVDQFHNIPAEYNRNTILAALDVFGPTIFVSIRNTVPSKKYADSSTLNSVIKYLQESGKVQGISRGTREIVFTDGSRVPVQTLTAQRFGFAKVQSNDFFSWKDFKLEELIEYKDLKELYSIPKIKDSPPILPYHKLYLNPNGETFPELGRFKILSGGNAYKTPIKEIIKNIDDNPLIPLIMYAGFAGILTALESLGKSLDLRATGDLHLHDRYLSQTNLMRKISRFLKKSGLEVHLRQELQQGFNKAKELIERGELKMFHACLTED